MASMGAPAEALALAYAGRASSKWPVVAEHLLSLELTAEQVVNRGWIEDGWDIV